MRQFYRKTRAGDQNGDIYALGYFVSPPTFDEAAPPPTPPTPVELAFLQRSCVCRLIARGLANHSDRLDAREWQQVKSYLQIFDPTAVWLPLHVAGVIDTTRRVADEQEGTYGESNPMDAPSFHAWANELVAALEQYRQDCASLVVNVQP